MEKYFSLVYPTVDVSNPGDGTLLISSPYGEWHAVEESPLYFRQVDGPFHFIFREDDRGRIAYLFTDYTPMMAFEKLHWYESSAFNMPLLLTSLLLFITMLPVALIRGIRSRRVNRDRFVPGGARIANRLIVTVSMFNLLFVAGNMLWGEQLVFGIPLAYKLVLGLGVLSVLLTTGVLIYCALAWKDHYWGLAFRVYYTAVTIGAVAFIWFLNAWNLLGWRY